MLPVGMSPPRDIESIVRDAFEDIALLIGGAAAVHDVDDDVVWKLLRGLDRVRIRTLRRFKSRPCTPSDARHPLNPIYSHPAVEEFLVRNRQGEGE